jgi:hypothetical protein
MHQAAAPRQETLTDHLINVAPAVPALALAAVALSLHYTADFGAAYRGGLEAWASGHPQRLELWTGTPFLAAVMALITRLAPEFVAARVFMAVNLCVWLVFLATVWPRLRPHVPPRFWWSTLASGALFAPAISTIFWLQFNLVIFVMALAGFVLMPRHHRAAGLLIGLSIALKPILILLPLVLLVRRRSRVTAGWAIGAAGVLSGLGLAFLAWRAGSPQVLNPFAYLQGFANNSASPIAACIVENYSPVATLCRVGVGPSAVITVLVAAAAVAGAWLLVRDLPETPEGEWEAFAAACFLSPFIGPIDWNHYGILTGPLFLLLAYQFWRREAPRPFWIGLGVAYMLTELVWDPLSSIAGASVPLLRLLYTAGQFGQYFLLLVWIRWRLYGVARERLRQPSFEGSPIR